MRVTEILRRIWLFSASKTKISESVGKQPTQRRTQLIIAAHNCHIGCQTPSDAMMDWTIVVEM